MGRTRHARKPRYVTRITRHISSTGHSSFQATIKVNLTGFGLQKPLGTLQCNALPVRGLSLFLALPSRRAVNELPCGGACFPSPHLHAGLTSGHRVDAVEPTYSASIGQPPNPMKAGAASNHWSWRYAQHHREIRLCISLQLVLSFIVNITRKRPELNCDKTRI